MSQGLVVQGELQLIGEKSDVHSRGKPPTGNAIVQQAAKQVNGVKEELALRAVCPRSRWQEAATRKGPLQQIGKVDKLLKIGVCAKTWQIDVESGIGADLGHEFLGAEHLLAGKSGLGEILYGALNRIESRRQLGLSRIICVDHDVILELGLDCKAQSKSIVEAGRQVHGVGVGAAEGAPVDSHFSAPGPCVIMADGESGKKEVRSQIDVDGLIATGGIGKCQSPSRNDFQEFGEIG